MDGELGAVNAGRSMKYIVKRSLKPNIWHGKQYGAQWVGCGTWMSSVSGEWNAREAAFKKAREVAMEYGSATLEVVTSELLQFERKT